MFHFFTLTWYLNTRYIRYRTCTGYLDFPRHKCLLIINSVFLKMCVQETFWSWRTRMERSKCRKRPTFWTAPGWSIRRKRDASTWCSSTSIYRRAPTSQRSVPRTTSRSDRRTGRPGCTSCVASRGPRSSSPTTMTFSSIWSRIRWTALAPDFRSFSRLLIMSLQVIRFYGSEVILFKLHC